MNTLRRASIRVSLSIALFAIPAIGAASADPARDAIRC